MDYPYANYWNLISEPLEELNDWMDIANWGTLEENLEDSNKEDDEQNCNNNF